MTNVRAAAPATVTSQSLPPRADLPGAFLAASTATPWKPRPDAARVRISAEFSPTPPVKASTSRPPGAAVIAAVMAAIAAALPTLGNRANGEQRYR